MSPVVSRASNSNDDRAAVMSRRGVLRIGGLSVGAAALAAACGEHARGEIGRVGAVPTTVKLPDAIVTNVTLLRTASSLEHSIINVYSQIVGKSDLLDPKYDEMIQRFMDDHTAQAKALEQLTTAAGGTAWTCSNPKIDDLIINPVITRVTKGTAATANAPAIKSSDDPRRDMLNFAHALETLAGESYQSFVPLLSEPALRSGVMKPGVNAARHAALLALTINTDRPGGLVNFTDAVNAEPGAAPTTTVALTTTTLQNVGNQSQAGSGSGNQPTPSQQTEIPSLTAIPSQFGTLAAIQLVVGRGDENGTRLKINLETPSLNSFVYEYMTPSC